MPGLVPGFHVFFPTITGTCGPQGLKQGFKFAKKNINKKGSRLKYKQDRRMDRSAVAKASFKGVW
jgi:hypothetical protein